MVPLLARNKEFRGIYDYYVTRVKNPLKRRQVMVAVSCKLIRVFYAVLTKGVEYDRFKMMSDIHRKSDIINDNTARNYMWLYRDTNHLPPKNAGRKRITDASKTPQTIEAKQPDFESYESMTKEELIQALIQARITEARLKKGYEVKGDGSVIHYSSKNIK